MKTDIINSAIGTGIAEIITLPVCTLRTNYLNSNMRIPETVGKIYGNYGILGFYKGSMSAIGSQVLSTSSKWTLYQYLNKNTNICENKHLKRLVNSSISGCISSLLTHPIDTIKIHSQMQKHGLYTEIRNFGPKFLYRGYSKSISKILFGNTIIFPLNDAYKDLFETKIETPIYRTGVSAFCSTITTTCLIHPIDYLKIRHIYGLSLYDGNNFKNYYRGLSLSLLRNIPHFTITMVFIDYLSS